MNIVYTLQDAPEAFTSAIFLAGPTPSDKETPSWRPAALEALEEAHYDGVVFVPEYADDTGTNDYEYSDQTEWEERCLNMADVILFWVPRDIKGGLPAYTTNIEWGKYQFTGKVVLGFPPGADKMRYMKEDADREGIPVTGTLEETIQSALRLIGDGAYRKGGERDVPLGIWNTESFQSWYTAQTQAGNRIDGARALWTFRVGPKRDILFYWAMHMNVWVESEQRHKKNEVVLSRPDISTIVAYHHPKKISSESLLRDTEVVLVREFRSPASTFDGFIREVPGGSSHKEGVHPSQVAADEWKEETGFSLSPSRFRFVQGRQLAGTMSAHQAYLFSVELTEDEMDRLKADTGVHGEDSTHGVTSEERTYLEVRTVGDLLDTGDVDWANMGMITQALLG